MEDKKKRSKGTKVALVIFVVLFVLALGALGYGYLKYDNVNNNYDELDEKYSELNSKYEESNSNLEKTNKQLDETNKNLESSKKKSEVSTENYITYDKNTNIYAANFYGIVLSYKGDMYHIVGTGSNGTLITDNMMKVAIKAGEKGFYCKADNDGDYECKACGRSEEGDGICTKAVKLGIKESDVNRVRLQESPGNTSMSSYALIVKKNGLVFGSNIGDGNHFEKIKLKNTNVDDIKIVCVPNKQLGFGCTKLIYKLTLKDGSKVEETKNF